MSTLIAVIGSLLGVVVGGGLTSWLARRAELRKIFLEALRSLAYVSAAGAVLTKASYGRTDGTADPEASSKLLERMHNEYVDAILDVRRALAAVAPFCPPVDERLRHWEWSEILSPATQAELQTILRRSLRRELRKL